MTEFGLLPEPGAIDAYLAAAGSKKNARSITSGYGRSDQDPRPVSFRERLMTEAYLVENTSSITPYVLRTTANPSQGNGGSCSGDSDGPMFCKGARIIPAVVSMGITRNARTWTSPTDSTGRWCWPGSATRTGPTPAEPSLAVNQPARMAVRTATPSVV